MSRKAMTPGKVMVRYCGAKTRSKTACRRPAGWGTPHPGRGRCKMHLGATRTHVKAEARAELREFALGHMGALPDVQPLEISLMAVQMAAGIVAHYRAQLAKLKPTESPSAGLAESYRVAMLDAASVSEKAIRAGVAERAVRLAERTAERLALAAEEALAAVKLKPADRAKFVLVFSASLRRLEEVSIDSTAEDE